MNSTSQAQVTHPSKNNVLSRILSKSCKFSTDGESPVNASSAMSPQT